MATQTDDYVKNLRTELAQIREDARVHRRIRCHPSKLAPYRYDLTALEREGASLEEIKRWLAKRGVSASRSGIFYALKRWSEEAEEANPMISASDQDDRGMSNREND